MSPLDDQLRAAMHAHADVLAPSPDPLAGIESRARGIKRRRVAALVAGAALAVASIAVAVPALQAGPSKGPAQVAATPTAEASFDPTSPWAFRGKISDGTLQHFRDELQARSPGLTLIPLFGQTYEPSGQEELAFAATDTTGRVDIIGYVTGSESGAEFTNFVPVTDHASFLFVLPGDEVQRLVVVACPTCSVSATGTTLTELAPGVAVGPYERRFEYVVRDADGAVVGRGSASAPGAPCSGSGGACMDGPANLLDWPTRGAMESALVAKLPEVYAPTLQTTADKVSYRVLFAGDTDSGVHYVMGQIWAAGDREAHSFAYAEGGTNGPSIFFGPTTDANAQVLAYLVSSLPGTTVDLLVVVPAPRTTQVRYDPTGNASYRPVADTPGADGVVLIDRAVDRGTGITDHLQLLTGNGDPATDVIAEGPVMKYLCGLKGCG